MDRRGDKKNREHNRNRQNHGSTSRSSGQQQTPGQQNYQQQQRRQQRMQQTHQQSNTYQQRSQVQTNPSDTRYAPRQSSWQQQQQRQQQQQQQQQQQYVHSRQQLPPSGQPQFPSPAQQQTSGGSQDWQQVHRGHRGPRSQSQQFPPQQNPQGNSQRRQSWTQDRDPNRSGVVRRDEQQSAAGASFPRSKFPTEALQPDVARTTDAYSKTSRKHRKQVNIDRTVEYSVSVDTNMYAIIFKPEFVTNAVHYDVNIEPEANATATKAICRKVFEECRLRHFPKRNPAFDGKKNAYSANDLPFNDFIEDTIEITNRNDRVIRYKITIMKVSNIDLSWLRNMHNEICNEEDKDQTGIQVLDVIFRHAPASRLLSIGRSLFSLNITLKDFYDGTNVLLGSFLSSVLGQKPYLNIDVVHKGFVKPITVDKILLEICPQNIDISMLFSKESNHKHNKPLIQKIETFLTGLKIVYELPDNGRSRRIYRINGLHSNAEDITFEFNGRSITVQKYFRQEKNYNIEKSTFPCIWVGSRNRESKTYLPAELCTIVEGQPIKDSSQSSKLIKYAAQNTTIRKNKINEAMKMLAVNNSSVLQNEFHLSVDHNMTRVVAKVLPALEICHQDSTYLISRGQWRTPYKFQKAIHLPSSSWKIISVVHIADISNLIIDFKLKLIAEAKHYGMELGEPLTEIPRLHTMSVQEIKNHLNNCKQSKLVIVIIPDDKTVYRDVKKIAELQTGVLTQCIKIGTICKGKNSTRPSYFHNLVQQINSKLNGLNHTVAMTGMPESLRKERCMFIGADVSHPSPDHRDIPSIVAISANHDDKAMKYSTDIKLQEPNQELIKDMTDMIYEKIRMYEKHTKMLPTKIIYYRDGVSEGQFAQVVKQEICQIRKACSQIGPLCNPQIACIIVQKRHHLRIFPLKENINNIDDTNNMNVNVGTVIDKEITHPNHIEFYLLSHVAVQGTARPTKYRCIHDEINLTKDDYERLTYYLCHTFVRCAKVLSYPVPTYYAHLAAFRARSLIDDIIIKMDQLKEEKQKHLTLQLTDAPMFFI